MMPRTAHRARVIETRGASALLSKALFHEVPS